MATPLEQIIKQHIAAHGPMNIGTYMQICLTHSEHGYYTTKNPLGCRGDFTTAPEISQIFGEMIGFWVADIWSQMGAPKDWILAEIGPGRGTLMADIMRILMKIPRVMSGCEIHFVEISEPLIEQQGQALAGLNVTWHDKVDDLPAHAPIIIVNNEFFDALPVHQYVKTEDGVDEVVIGVGVDGALTLGRVKSSQLLPDCPIGQVVEVSPSRTTMFQILLDKIKQPGGAVLTIDYGYDVPVGSSTLQAVRTHEKVSFLDTPGQADLTALVNFKELAALARAGGAKVAGPVGQGDFLRKLGIEERVRIILRGADTEQHNDIISGVTRLIAPDQMGALFLVLVVWNNNMELIPAGF